jgi:hypothetical protein
MKIVTTACLIASVAGDHAMPSSLLQISSGTKTEGQPSIDAFLATMNKDVETFRRKMDAEIRQDQQQVQKMAEQQRKLDREEKAFKAKVLAHHEPMSARKSSFIESNTHFGDPYIDEAMRVIGDEIDSQKRELERVISSNGAAPAALIEEKHGGPNLGLIAEALRTRLNLVGQV